MHRLTAMYLWQTQWEFKSWTRAGSLEAEVNKFLFSKWCKCECLKVRLKIFFFSFSSHKSSSIQKETPKKKPKLELKPSNGDRYDKKERGWICLNVSVNPPLSSLHAISILTPVALSPSRWILEAQTTSFSSASWRRKWCHWRDSCSKGTKPYWRRTVRCALTDHQWPFYLSICI